MTTGTNNSRFQPEAGKPLKVADRQLQRTQRSSLTSSRLRRGFGSETYECEEDRHPRIEARVNELAAAPATDPRLFTPPEGAKKSKAGVIEFLAKPLRDQDLLEAIQVALEKDRVGRQHEAEVALLEDRLQGLTPREREVLGMVVSGMLNKQIASRIGTTENTTRVYRSRVMEKVQAQSLADLVRMAERLQISFPKAS